MIITDPRIKSPIPVHAGVIQFTPPSLDPMGQFERALPMLEAAATEADDRVIKLMRERDEGKIVGTHAEHMIRDAGFAKIEAVAQIGRRRKEASALAERVGAPPKLTVKVPTAVEREKLNVRLIELGVTTISEDQIRASLIETIYEIDWARDLGRPNLDVATYADETAAALDSYWQKQAVQAEANQRWREQEMERMLDRSAGAPYVSADELPPKLVSPREDARMQLLVDRLMEEPRMRRIMAKRLDFTRRNAMILARINVRAVSGMGVDVSPEPITDALSEEDAARVREAFDVAYGKELGNQAWIELIGFIDGLYGLEEFEVGNSASPLGKSLAPTGSSEPSDAMPSNGGNLTASDIDQAPDAASGTTTAKSSDSTSGAVVPITSNGPTDAA